MHTPGQALTQTTVRSYAAAPGTRPGRVALLLVVLALVACSHGGVTTGPFSGGPPAATAGGPATFGGPTAVGNLGLTLSDPRPGGDDVPDPASDEAGTVEFTARSENPTGRAARNPDVAVYCADGRRGGWFAVSRWEPGADLPAHSYMEGRLVLGVPIRCAAPEVRASDYHRHWKTEASWALPPRSSPPTHRLPDSTRDYDGDRFSVHATLLASGCAAREQRQFSLSGWVSRVDDTTGEGHARVVACGPFRSSEDMDSGSE